LFCAGYIILKELIRNGCEIFVSKISLEAKWTLSSLNCNRCSNMSFRQPEVKDYTCAGWALNMVNNSIPFYNPSLHSLYCLSILSTRDSLWSNSCCQNLGNYMECVCIICLAIIFFPQSSETGPTLPVEYFF
jgi:hypothetical protein